MTHDPGSCDVFTTMDEPVPPDQENATLRALLLRAARAKRTVCSTGYTLCSRTGYGDWFFEIKSMPITTDELTLLRKITEEAR